MKKITAGHQFTSRTA